MTFLSLSVADSGVINSIPWSDAGVSIHVLCCICSLRFCFPGFNLPARTRRSAVSHAVEDNPSLHPSTTQTESQGEQSSSFHLSDVDVEKKKPLSALLLAPSSRSEMSISTLFTKEGLAVAFYLMLNVVSVVGCVAFNKMLYQPPHNFKFASSLMTFHFLCTWGFVVLAKKLGWFTSKKIETDKYVKLGAAQTGSVGFVNLSLLFNSIGMYQILKFTNVLVICAIEFVWKNKSYNSGIYLSLIVLVFGVTFATVTNVETSWVGLMHGCLGSLSTAIYQILNKSIQVDSDVKPLQLLEYEQPFTALWSAVFALLTDDVRGLLSYPFTPTTIGLLLMSGIFAFGVNVTCYVIIGRTSPVTYGVVGHTKTVFIMLFGIFVMGERPGPKTGLGMLVAFGAIVAYTHITTSRSAGGAKKEDDAVPSVVTKDVQDDVGGTSSANDPATGSIAATLGTPAMKGSSHNLVENGRRTHSQS